MVRKVKAWLGKLKLPAIPIEKLVVYSNSNTILKNLTNGNELPKLVIQKEKLLEKIDEYSTKHSSPRLSDDQLTELSFRLLTAHTEPKINILNKFNVKESELIKGVRCPSCSAAPMLREVGKWTCFHCGTKNKTAHQSAFIDYAFLINEYINNRQAKNFLQIESSYVTKRLLQKEKYEEFGVKSGRRYKINVDHFI